MMPGDIPCNEPCGNVGCQYNSFGTCMDNAPCPAQISREEWDARRDFWTEAKDDE